MCPQCHGTVAHAAREKNRANQSKPYAEKQNKKIVYKTLLIYTMYLTLLYKGKCTTLIIQKNSTVPWNRSDLQKTRNTPTISKTMVSKQTPILTWWC
jgi:hypothetical protein